MKFIHEYSLQKFRDQIVNDRKKKKKKKKKNWRFLKFWKLCKKIS